MQANILVIEDETELAELIGMYLRKEGIEPCLVETAEAGLQALRERRFDLVLLDINLPGMDGFEFLHTLRRNDTVPVIVVSAREADEDIVMGLSAGADEFITKPFSPRVLVARVRAFLRRVRTTPSSRKLITFGSFNLDAEGFSLWKGEERVPLSSREFEVLRYLVLNAGTPVTADTIYGEVWGNVYGDPTAVAVYVQHLRHKIESDPKEPYFLQTIHGQGYWFNPNAIQRN